jgi:hypothetical protein
MAESPGFQSIYDLQIISDSCPGNQERWEFLMLPSCVKSVPSSPALRVG